MPRIIIFLYHDVPYLVSHRSRLLFITFTTFFSLIFISLYNPFHLDQWGENLYLQFAIRGTAILLISQFLLRPFFGLQRFVFYQLILWCLTEIILMSLIFYYFYGEEANETQGIIYQLFDTFGQVGLVVIVPYILFISYSEFYHRLSEIEDIQIRNVVSIKNDPEKLLIFHSMPHHSMGDSDKINFAIRYNQLLFIKSAGNYIEIYYRKGHKVEREVLRASLKELDNKISGTDVIKVHRSYVINMNHISSFKKTKKGYSLSIDQIPDVLIPVSSGYKVAFEKALNQSLPHS